MKTRYIFGSLLIVLIQLFCFPIELKADQDFRNHRYESFKSLPPHRDGDIVFIGNSITNMMNWNELFGNQANIKNRGVSGGFTYEILEHLNSIISGNPSKIFLMIGTNDLGQKGKDNNPEAVAYRIEKIISRIHKENPDAEIYYQSILPSKKGLRTENKTLETNKLVENWINQQNDHLINYIDLYSAFVDNDGDLKNTAPGDSLAFSFDGLHLTQKGYKLWADIIQDYIGSKSVLNDNFLNLNANMSGSNGMRVSHFGGFPVENKDILLIGDELIHGGEWHELMGSTDFKDRGIGWGFPGLALSSIKNILPAILSGNIENGANKENPSAIVLYAGMNEILKGDSISSIMSKYTDVINYLTEKTPSTSIFIMTLVPPGESDKKYSPAILSLNQKIKELTKLNNNIHLIDIYDAFINNNQRNNLFFLNKNSSLLNGQGYTVIAGKLAEAINPVLSTNYQPIILDQAKEILSVNILDAHKAQDTYIVFDNSNSKVPYRIPAIARTKNGDIICVADYRHSFQDIGMAKNGRLDLHYRIKNVDSEDWEKVTPLIEAIGEGDEIIAFGDPCVVADRESDLILVTSCSGNVSFPKGTKENHQGIAKFYSYDGGKTWSDYEEIGHHIYQLLDKRTDGPVHAYFVGSGKISQSRNIKVGSHYRIYCSVLARVKEGKTKVNYVIYSDDFGRTWNLLGDINDCPIPEGADEPKAEELPDGRVLVSSRISGGRFFNIFTYDDLKKGTGKWGQYAISDENVNGVVASKNACNGEILTVPVIRKSDEKPTFLLLQSAPLSSEGKRSNVGINYKDLGNLADDYSPSDLAKDWDGKYQVTSMPSAYSTMVLDHNYNISFFYEKDLSNGGYDMIYKNISIEELTHGKYKAHSREK